MNFKELLSDPKITDFIIAHKHLPLSEIALKLAKQNNLPKNFIINQINGLQKAKNKLPTLYNKPIVYPEKVSLEQCSSEYTARHKASKISGSSLLDLTLGWGIDSIYFSGKFNTITAVEPNKSLLQIAHHNLQLLGISNKFKLINQKAEDFLNENNKHPFDWIYIDPSRRTNAKKKVVDLKKYSPNVIELLPQLFELSNHILIKIAPFADIKYLETILPNIKSIEVVAVKKECKEILIELEKNYTGTINYIATHITNNHSKTCFNYHFSENKNYTLPYAESVISFSYLYIPNVATSKLQAFKAIANYYNLNPISENTHLLVSNKLIPEFQGQIFEIKQAISPKSIKNKKISVVLKNYPLKHSDFLKKYKLTDIETPEILIGYRNSSNKPEHILVKRV